MAKLGTSRNPAVVRVQSQERATAILRICDERGWQAIVGIEPDKSEGVQDVERLLGARLDLSALPGGLETLCLFFHAFPDLAVAETRSALILRDDRRGLPVGEYSFLELYCVDPHCECRHALIWVVRDQDLEPVATIRHRFDVASHGPEQTTLDPQATQSADAGAALRLFRVALTDPQYAARLERHYRMFKEVVSDPDHPINERLRAEGLRAAEPILQASLPAFPGGPLDLGLKKPCPCGSGRKYKHCCRDREAVTR